MILFSCKQLNSCLLGVAQVLSLVDLSLTHTHAYTLAYTRTHTPIHTRLHTRIQTHTHSHSHAYTRIHTPIHTRIHIGIHTGIHTHTHTHTHSSTKSSLSFSLSTRLQAVQFLCIGQKWRGVSVGVWSITDLVYTPQKRNPLKPQDSRRICAINGIKMGIPNPHVSIRRKRE